MRPPEERSPVEVLRDLSAHEIMIVSFAVLPVILGLWTWVLNATISSSGWYWYLLRFLTVFGAIPALYFLGINYLRKNESDREKLQRQRKLLVARLKQRKGHMSSIERLAAVDSEPAREISEERIEKLMTTFPGFFHPCTIKAKNPDEQGKPGVKLADEES